MTELLEVKDLTKVFAGAGTFWSRRQPTYAVEDVSLTLSRGETLAIVGESGSGKTTLGRCVLKLIEATEGSVIFEGTNILELRNKDLQTFRRKAQMVFQNPQGSLDPRMRVATIVAQPIKHHEGLNGSVLERRVIEALVSVGLSESDLQKYPHEMSGGQQQRVAIARAISTRPDLLVLDEPTSALDASIQGQIIALLDDLRDAYEMSYLFISHDLRLVRAHSDRTAVMYKGKLMELGRTADVFHNPRHPYMRLLEELVPTVPANPLAAAAATFLMDDTADRLETGCVFRSRCPAALAACESPQALIPEDADHQAACWRHVDPEFDQEWQNRLSDALALDSSFTRDQD